MKKTKSLVARTPEDLARVLDLPPAIAKEWRVQHDLLKRLKRIVQTKGLTHSDVAALAGTSRTRVTAILNGELKHVSTDLLIRILASLGYRVNVSVTRADTAA